MREFIAGLHSNEQHYVPIVDSNIYAPNPDNESDAYEPWQRGADLGTFIRTPSTGDFYFGDNCTSSDPSNLPANVSDLN